jgi:hypothetical protein
VLVGVWSGGKEAVCGGEIGEDDCWVKVRTGAGDDGDFACEHVAGDISAGGRAVGESGGVAFGHVGGGVCESGGGYKVVCWWGGLIEEERDTMMDSSNDEVCTAVMKKGSKLKLFSGNIYETR